MKMKKNRIFMKKNIKEQVQIKKIKNLQIKIKRKFRSRI